MARAGGAVESFPASSRKGLEKPFGCQFAIGATTATLSNSGGKDYQGVVSFEADAAGSNCNPASELSMGTDVRELVWAGQLRLGSQHKQEPFPSSRKFHQVEKWLDLLLLTRTGRPKRR